mgnify:CR=1 FL=1
MKLMWPQPGHIQKGLFTVVEISGHAAASDESRALCDQLFLELRKLIPGLKRSEAEKWCGFYQNGTKRFAYIDHRKKIARIDVWCLGDPDAFGEFAGLDILKRKPTSGGFGRAFGCHFFLNDLADVALAAEALYVVSFALS